jgi:hypothetical protein
MTAEASGGLFHRIYTGSSVSRRAARGTSGVLAHY